MSDNSKRSKDFAKNTAILTFGKICTQSISFLLLPLYTAILEPVDYGAVDLIVTYNTLLLTLVALQFDQGLFRFMLDDRYNKKRNIELFSSILSISVVQVTVFGLLYYILQPFVTLQYKHYMAVDVILSVFLQLFMQFVRGLGKSADYAIASFISAAGTVIFNVFFLVVLHLDGLGLIYSIILSKTLAICYLFCKNQLWHYYSIKCVNRDVFTAVAKYSIPLVPNNLAWWIINASDRTIIVAFLGTALNGIYTVANKFSNVFINFYNILNLSWTENVSLHFNDDDRDEYLAAMVTTLFNLFAAACIGIIACLPLVFNSFINEKYAEAYPHIPILMIAMLFRVVVGLYSVVYVAQKKTVSIMLTTIGAALINVVVHLILINKIGLFAASFSTLISFAIVAIYRYIDVNRTLRMHIEKRSLVLTIIACCIILPLYYHNEFAWNVVSLLVAICYAFIINKDILRDVSGTLKKLKREGR